MEIEKLQINFEGHKKYAEIVNKQQIRLLNIFFDRTRNSWTLDK